MEGGCDPPPSLPPCGTWMRTAMFIGEAVGVGVGGPEEEGGREGGVGRAWGGGGTRPSPPWPTLADEEEEVRGGGGGGGEGGGGGAPSSSLPWLSGRMPSSLPSIACLE